MVVERITYLSNNTNLPISKLPTLLSGCNHYLIKTTDSSNISPALPPIFLEQYEGKGKLTYLSFKSPFLMSFTGWYDSQKTLISTESATTFALSHCFKGDRASSHRGEQLD